MMSDGLKPCPFCGATPFPAERILRTGRPKWEVACVSWCCSVYGSTKKGAITLWNTRPPDPLFAEMLGLLKDIHVFTEEGASSYNCAKTVKARLDEFIARVEKAGE